MSSELVLGTCLRVMILVVMAFAFAACGQLGDRQINIGDLEALPKPVLIWGSDNKLCGATRAVDGERSVWRESGCEGPIRLDNTGTTDQRTFNELLGLYESFPEPEPSPAPDCDGQVKQSFSWISPESTKSWFFCTNPHDYGDPSGLEEPFLSVAKIFNQLP